MKPEVIASIVGIFANIGLVGAMIYSLRSNNRNVKDQIDENKRDVEQQIQQNREDVNRQIMLNSKMKTINELRRLTSEVLIKHSNFDTDFSYFLSKKFGGATTQIKINSKDALIESFRLYLYYLEYIDFFVSTSNFISDKNSSITEKIQDFTGRLGGLHDKYINIDVNLEFDADAFESEMASISDKFYSIYEDLKELIREEQQYIDNPAYLFENSNGDSEKA